MANWWDRHGVPRVIRFACGMKAIRKLRAKVVPLAQGDVFELGCGGGLNQPYYDREKVRSFAGIDPGAKLLDYARAEAAQKGWEADIREGFGETIPFEDEQFDTVVCTFTLCSVQDQAQVVREMRRILRPGGQLLFLEHGRAPDDSVAAWQERIEPWWKPVAGGCHLTRPITSAVAEGGFETEALGATYLPKTPRILGWNEWGRGIKQGR